MGNKLFNLHIFEGEGAGGAEGGLANQDASTKVVYGKQSTNAEANTESHPSSDTISAEDRRAQFDAMIKGEYKDLYQEQIKSTIDKRLKNVHDNQDTIDKYNSVLAPIYERYGIDNGKFEELSEAISNDESLYQDEADRLGMTAEQLLYLKQQERARAEAEEKLQRLEGARRAQEDYNGWIKEGEELKQMYPDFDLQEEVGNTRFTSLLSAGWSVQEAYEATHAHELIKGAIGTASSVTENRVVSNIRARNSRPRENGLGSNSGVIVKTDPTKFTKKDFEDIARRVREGETIVL